MTANRVRYRTFDGTYTVLGGLYTTDAAPDPGAAIVAAVNAASTAGIAGVRYTAPCTTQPNTTPNVGADVRDGARLTFATSAGTLVTLLLASPGAVYLGDNETVNPAAPAVAALITACLAGLSDATGNVVTAYVKGTRFRTPTPPWSVP